MTRAPHRAPRRFPLHGSRPVHRPGAVRRRRVEDEIRLQVSIVLRPEELPDDHPVAVKTHAQDTLGGLAEPLTAEELATLHAPPETAVEEVRRFAEEHRLEVLDVSRLRHDVLLEGTVGDLNRAFAVTQHEYEHAHGRYRAHDEPLQVPESWSGSVLGVVGLDTVPHHRPHAAGAPDPGAHLWQPAEIAEVYRFPPPADASSAGSPGSSGFPAAGRLVLLEFGGGFDPHDVQGYLAERGLPAAEITVVPVTAGDGTAGGNTPLAPDVLRAVMKEWRAGLPYAQLQELFGPALAEFTTTLEVTMDLEIAAALAPGAPLAAVFAPGTADGWRRALFAALGEPLPGSVPPPRAEAPPLPAAISISWGISEQGWGAMKLRLLHQALESARRLGVTVCCSSGDFGSRNSPQPGSGSGAGLNVNFPASSPAVLACGGTTLMAGGALRGERAWKQTLRGVPVASGGGMSGFFPRPAHQAGLDTPEPAGTWLADGTAAGFEGRWVPDVAASADFTSAIALRLAGEAFSGGGTSAATPIWAALVSRLAAVLGRPLGWLAPILYRRAGEGALSDIRDGNNDLSVANDSTDGEDTAPGNGPLRYSARPGWDPCTGLGSPRGRELLEALRRAFEKAASTTAGGP